MVPLVFNLFCLFIKLKISVEKDKAVMNRKTYRYVLSFSVLSPFNENEGEKKRIVHLGCVVFIQHLALFKVI